MEAEMNYIEYVTSFSLSILAASATYFLDFSRPITYISLIMVPLLYGYTVYISRNGFRKSSLLSVIALFFIPINPVMAITGILISVGNPLLSAFAGGNSFKDYFRAVSIPLLVTGIMVGLTGFYMLDTQPELKKSVTNQTAEKLGEETAEIAENTDMVGNYQNMQAQLITTTSESSIAAAQAKVLNETQGELEPEDIQMINSAFDTARREIPEQMANETTKKLDQQDTGMSSTVADSFRNLLSHDKSNLAVIPLAAIFIYGLNPLVGILTGIFATFFRKLDTRFDVFSVT